MTTRRHFMQSAASLAAFGAFPMAAFAQSLETVKIINGFPAGGTADNTSRRIAEKLGGTAFSKNGAVVENKTGAAGRIAIETVKNGPADGSQLLLTPHSTITTYPHIYKSLSYDPFKDLQPVSIAAIISHGFAVGPLVPASVKNLKDFLAWAKANPEKASYGTPAAGSMPHFVAALMGISAGVELKHIPYRGSLPAVADCLGGQIAAVSAPAGDSLANHRAGKLRLLATSSPKRTPFTPEVATFAEQGFPELAVEEWFGVYAPAKTPASVVANANAAIVAATKDKSVVDSLALMGLVAQGSTVAEMEKSQREEFNRWGPLVKKIGFSAES